MHTAKTSVWAISLIFSANLYAVDSPFSRDAAIIQQLENAAENSWVKLNTNHFIDVWTPEAQRAPTDENLGLVQGEPISIIEAWSSMVWDSQRGHLIFWGGGHANYTGNEVYLWNANNLQWERASLPSAITPVDPSQDTNWFQTVGGIDDAPVSSHTYDNSEFLPIADRFVTFGGAAYNLGSPFLSDANINQNTGPYFWNPSTANPDATSGGDGTQVYPDRFPDVVGGFMWENRDNFPQTYPNYNTLTINGASAYTEENGKDVLLITIEHDLFKYTVNDANDASQDSYKKVGTADEVDFNEQGAGAYDPKRKLFVRSSGSQLLYWDLNLPTPSEAKFIHLNNPDGFDTGRLDVYGLDFDPNRDQYLLWDGANSVWALSAPDNLNQNWQISRVSDGSGSSQSPTDNELSGTILDFETNFKGIFGKWKYIAALDVFLGVADPVRGDIWAFKPSNWELNYSLSFNSPTAPTPLSPPEAGCNDNTSHLTCISRSGKAVINHTKQQFSFSDTLPDTPVVISGIPTLSGMSPGVASVTQVTADGFEMRFKEWDYLDQQHAPESISYLAMLPGTYNLADGSVIEVGTFRLGGTGNWETTYFQNSFATTPKLLLTPQTENGFNTVTVRANNIYSDSFEAALFEEEALMSTGHVGEIIGYIAIDLPEQSGTLQINEQDIAYKLSSTRIGLQPRSVFDFSIVLEEEQSADEELLHYAQEAVDVLKLGDMLFGQITSNSGLDTVSLRRAVR